eukprot:945494-Pleurochrysis_carterae.AAC.1
MRVCERPYTVARACASARLARACGARGGCLRRLCCAAARRTCSVSSRLSTRRARRCRRGSWCERAGERARAEAVESVGPRASEREGKG